MNLIFLDWYDLDAKPEVKPVNEHGALMYAGRWGIHGVSLPGRVTFSPGNVGWATFGAPRPQQVYSSIRLHILLTLSPSLSCSHCESWSS